MSIQLTIDREILREEVLRKISKKKQEKKLEKDANLSGQQDKVNFNPEEPLLYGNPL